MAESDGAALNAASTSEHVPTWRELTHQDKPPLRRLAALLFEAADARDDGEEVTGSELRELANEAVQIADEGNPPDTSERAGVPARHPATADAWAWLQSRTVQELTTEKRDEIAEKLMALDAELWSWDA